VSQGLWIAIAVIAVLVVAALVIGLVRYRRRQISLRRSSEVATPIDRSGGYTASSGITFTQSSATATDTGGRERSDSGIDTGGRERSDSGIDTGGRERSDSGIDTGVGRPGVGDDAAIPRDSIKRPISEVRLPEPPVAEKPPVPEAPPAAPEAPAAPDLSAIAPTASDVDTIAPTASDVDTIAPTEGRLERLRGRLAKSQNALGRSMLGLLGGGDLDEASWQEVEDTLLIADLGPVVTASVVEQLRSKLASSNVRSEAEARAVLREVLIAELNPGLDRSIKALPHADKPSVLLVVGVNGTGKTTTVGKLARVLVADGRRVVLGAADTFRAAAADQLQSWASRVGAEVVRGAEGADPASVAFDAVDKGIAAGADVVVIDTAGRLHTKTGLMDELGKVKRVVSKRAAVDEVLLVLDATIGQNGLAQARVFAEVVDITGVALTKLDGTAKGGIVFRVQQELGVPVKLVGLGEGPDDLAPFEPGAFVDALLG
jgi:fused signal recognition particle receptor